MTQSDREKEVCNLCNAINMAKLELEVGMDDIIKEGLTKEVSAPLKDIAEIALKLLKDKTIVPIENGRESVHWLV
ncbi:MAG: hypothetical protein FWB80_01460 [Defluviitaleaceae bacterium]|nr:hypothetical protein [Defluviitaleaceae bacterium]